MQRLLVYCCLSLIWFNVFSQRTIDVDKDPNVNGGILQNVFTMGGKPFVTAKFSKVVEGSPFFNEQLMPGIITLNEGKEYKDLSLRLNLLESQVNYLGDKNIEMMATSAVKVVVLRDTIQKTDHRFVFSEYMDIYNKPEKGFYELLEPGKAELYKEHKKKLLESRPYGSATIEQTIKTEVRYYISLNGQWIKIKKLKELTDLFYRKKNEIQKFISDKKISGDDEASLKMVTAYYNSLFTTQ